ncbi:MAG TPA: putative LPS assembly protein LptD [Bacteroidota bacterium]|nr:putative LPS assembly protein LptD [Bacteroidota bacterium]
MARLSSNILFSVLVLTAAAEAQTADTVFAPADTSASSSVSGIDTVVTYSAKDSIIYSMRTRFMDMYSKSEIQHQTVGLKAERVSVDWDNATLIATGVRDTSIKGRDTTMGNPVLKDGGENYFGTKVGYNFRTRKGKIDVGTTVIEQGFYKGKDIKKVDTDVLFVADGRYTTCDASHPHFYFYSPKMKVIVRDKVIAEPVYFYLADVPLFALPFGVFPSRGGKTSGIIPPAYGEDGQRGHFFSHFGYYWAINDYMDFATTFDWYARGGWLNHSIFRYNLQYNFDGSINANVSNTHDGEPKDPGRSERRDYNIAIGHHQTINPSTRLDVNFSFASGSYFRNYSKNLNEILLQNLVSNATLYKSWETSNRSLSVNISRDQSLITGDTREGLPSISFSQGQVYPFRKRTKSRGLTAGSESEFGFFEMIGLNYNSNFANFRQKTSRSVDSIKIDPTNSLQLARVTEFQRIYTQTLNQNASVSLSPKLGNFTVSPSLRFDESRTFSQTKTPERNVSDSSLVFTSGGDQSTRGNVNAGVATSTRLFGIVQPQMFGVTSIRHALTPTFGLNYAKQIYGRNIPKYSMTGSLNIGNNFEMKYQQSDTAKEEKIQLMNIGGGVSYNFAGDSLRLSPLSVSYRTDIGRYLSISASTTHNFYVFEPSINRGFGGRINKFLLSETGKFADLTSVFLSLSTSLSGEKKQKASDQSIPESVRQEQDRVSGEVPQERRIYRGIYDQEEADFSIPWNLSLNYNFSQFQENPRVVIRSSNVNANLSFNLTEKWQISGGTSYDLVQRQFSAPHVNVTRDLHCWTMNFYWLPLGQYRYYRFEIRVKAPQLQDLKVTKQGSQTGFYQ